MRVATWNIARGRPQGGGEPPLAPVAAGIRALRADLVALQEVDRDLGGGQADKPEAIAKEFGPGWFSEFTPALEGNGSHQPGGPAKGNLLLSRLPLREVERLPFSPPDGGEERIALLATIQVESRPVTVAAVQLSSEEKRNGGELWELQRVLEGRLAPRLLIGDLNMRSPELRQASRRGWPEATRERTPESSSPGAQVGHVLYNDPAGVLQVLDSRVLPVPVKSYALVVNLVVSAPSG
jgi:endonuclease/exonuclease/phosphatase family metal-dependent hydrolase